MYNYDRRYNGPNTSPWIDYLYYVTRITISEGVTSIGNNAFCNASSGYYGLPSVTIPTSVTSIGQDAFSCFRIGELIVNCSIIPDNAFRSCPVNEVTIGEGVTSIGNEAFRECEKLTSITIPENVLFINNGAFMDCSNLAFITFLGYVIIGRDSRIFKNCSNEITVNGNIPDNAFWGCDMTKIIIGEGTTSIGESAFVGCHNLSSVVIPTSVKLIGGYAFGECSSLTSIIIPESVIDIGNYTFLGCSNLTAITIPESVEEIGEDMFEHCN